MTYQRAAWKALYRLIQEDQLSETEALAIAKSIFYPSVIEVPAPQTCEDTPSQPEADRVVVKGFMPQSENGLPGYTGLARRGERGKGGITIPPEM